MLGTPEKSNVDAVVGLRHDQLASGYLIVVFVCNESIDGRPKWTTILFCRASLDEQQLAINCEMAAALVMVEMMKHCVVGGMDLQFVPHGFGL